MQRYFLSMLYHKGQCVLHRKFLSKARENNKYAHSRRTCLDSSLELLAHQATLHYGSQPGGRLHNVRVLLNSLTSHDFLLAAMIISLDLCQGAEAERLGRDSADLYTWGAERRDEMIRALETSINIWKETRETSMESYKASEILTVMIQKIKNYVQTNANTNGGRQQAPMTPFPSFPSMANGNTNSPYGAAPQTQQPPPQPQMEDKPEHSAAMTLGMLSSGGLTPNASALYNNHGNGYPSNTNMESLQQQQQNNPSAASSGMTPNYAMEPQFSFMSGGPTDMPLTVDWVSHFISPFPPFPHSALTCTSEFSAME